MSSTAGEFQRAMVKAIGDAVTEEGGGLLVVEGNVRLHFALISETPQQVGALQLCALRVVISAQAGDEEAVSSLLARIDRATQRGGG
ncbi:MAG: hypothetical protein IPN75_06830 [Dechloromonas sp.]|jgi:hypothetical protein|uniref:Uncharacterized protein n=1 Tax=Candidatus Dechloromonas phosphorivorans TaxID=2899244 RepID=A0A9D7LLM9_9RHOO|nr:hypothetical protein [Candidatus Dechloromonas phosphorivorans]